LYDENWNVFGPAGARAIHGYCQIGGREVAAFEFLFRSQASSSGWAREVNCYSREIGTEEWQREEYDLKPCFIGRETLPTFAEFNGTLIAGVPLSGVYLREANGWRQIDTEFSGDLEVHGGRPYWLAGTWDNHRLRCLDTSQVLEYPLSKGDSVAGYQFSPDGSVLSIAVQQQLKAGAFGVKALMMYEIDTE
jgi:hypothetical protein